MRRTGTERESVGLVQVVLQAPRLPGWGGNDVFLLPRAAKGLSRGALLRLLPGR